MREIKFRAWDSEEARKAWWDLGRDNNNLCGCFYDKSTFLKAKAFYEKEGREILVYWT